MRYAIVTSGAVTNVIALREFNAGDFPGAVALHDRPVGIGDTYSESKFWRDGEELLTSDEKIAAMQTAAVAVLRFVVADNDRLAAGALYPKWAAGAHSRGDIYTARCTLPRRSRPGLSWLPRERTISTRRANT